MSKKKIKLTPDDLNKIVSNLSLKREEVKGILSRKLKRKPTFREVTEEVRRTQGDKSVFDPKNILNNVFSDAYSAYNAKNIQLSQEKLAEGCYVLSICMSKQIFTPEEFNKIVDQLVKPFKTIQLKKHIYSSVIEKTIDLTMDLDNYFSNKAELNKKTKIIKDIAVGYFNPKTRIYWSD